MCDYGAILYASECCIESSVVGLNPIGEIFMNGRVRREQDDSFQYKKVSVLTNVDDQIRSLVRSFGIFKIQIN